MSNDTVLPLKIQVLQEYVVIDTRVHTSAFHLEFSLQPNFAFPSLTHYLRGTPDEQLFAIEVLGQWQQVIEQIELKYIDPGRQLVATKKLLSNFSSKEFKRAWQEAEKGDAEYTSIKHNLLYLVALYSDKADDIGAFVSEVKEICTQRGHFIPNGLDLEKQLISVLYKDTAQKEIKQELLYDDILYNEIMNWLRKRVNILEIRNLVSAKRRYDQLRKKECRELLRHYKQAKRRGSKREIQNSLSNALRLCPDNIRVAYFARGNISLDKTQKKRTHLKSFSLLSRSPIIALFFFTLLLLFYAIPRLITLFTETFHNMGSIQNIGYGAIFSQLLFLALYGFFTILLFKSLTETLVFEPLRTWLALAFISSVLPVTGSLWSQLIGLSDSQWTAIILSTLIICCIFFYRDGYKEISKVTQYSREARNRTIIMMGILIGQALLYALIASDFVGRFNFPGTSPSPNLHRLAQDYIWKVMPKLIDLPIAFNLHVYIFPPIIIVLTLSPFVLSTLQSGVTTLTSSSIKQTND